MIDTNRSSEWLRPFPGGKTISALGFGCAGVWATPQLETGVAERMLRDAVEQGVNHFDTSPSYGLTIGETRLASLAQAVDRGRLIVSTKVGSNVFDGTLVRGFDVAMMTRSFDESMARLKLDHVDILYLHGPAAGDLNHETFMFLDSLKASGRIALSGVNSFNPERLDALVDTPIDAVMLQYNVEDQSCWPQLHRLHAAGKFMISGTAIGRGKFDLRNFIPRDRASLFYLARMAYSDPLFPINGWRLRRRLLAVPQPPAATAVQFVTGHPAISSTLFSTRNPQRLVANIAAGKQALAPDPWTTLVQHLEERVVLAA